MKIINNNTTRSMHRTILDEKKGGKIPEKLLEIDDIVTRGRRSIVIDKSSGRARYENMKCCWTSEDKTTWLKCCSIRSIWSNLIERYVLMYDNEISHKIKQKTPTTKWRKKKRHAIGAQWNLKSFFVLYRAWFSCHSCIDVVGGGMNMVPRRVFGNVWTMCMRLFSMSVLLFISHNTNTFNFTHFHDCDLMNEVVTNVCLLFFPALIGEICSIFSVRLAFLVSSKVRHRRRNNARFSFNHILIGTTVIITKIPSFASMCSTNIPSRKRQNDRTACIRAHRCKYERRLICVWKMNKKRIDRVFMCRALAYTEYTQRKSLLYDDGLLFAVSLIPLTIQFIIFVRIVAAASLLYRLQHHRPL